jgi:hypothetical protein
MARRCLVTGLRTVVGYTLVAVGVVLAALPLTLLIDRVVEIVR